VPKSGLLPSEALFPSEAVYPADRGQVAIRQEDLSDRMMVYVEPAGGGDPARWAADEPLAENRPTEIRMVDEMNGGEKEAAVTLARDPKREWRDAEVYSQLTIKGSTGEILWGPGEIDKVDATDSETNSITVTAVGYQAALSDNNAVKVGLIDPDMTKFGEPSARLVAANKSIQYNRNGQAELLAAGDPDGGDSAAIVHSWSRMANNGGADPDVVISVLDTNGIEVGRVIVGEFDPVEGVGASESWQNAVIAGNNDLFEDFEVLADFNGAGESAVELEVAAFRTVIALQDYYAGSIGEDGNWQVQWRNVTVEGRHSLTPRISPDGVRGFGADQILGYVVPEYAPPLEVTVDSVEDDEYVIPRAWWDTPTTVAAITEEVAKYGQLPWFCKGRVFHRHWPGRFGRRWKAYVGLDGAGADAQRLWEAIVVQWQDTDGRTYLAGPPGSGADVIDESLRVVDPENPAVKSERGRQFFLPLKRVGTAASAIAAAQRALEDLNELDTAGTATLKGYVEDEFGVRFPVSYVRGWDLVSFPRLRDKSYRRLTRRECAGQELTLNVDAPPESYEVLLERYEADIASLGI